MLSEREENYISLVAQGVSEQDAMEQSGLDQMTLRQFKRSRLYIPALRLALKHRMVESAVEALDTTEKAMRGVLSGTDAFIKQRSESAKFIITAAGIPASQSEAVQKDPQNGVDLTKLTKDQLSFFVLEAKKELDALALSPKTDVKPETGGGLLE